MMRRPTRTHDIATGTGAALLLLAIIVGVPVALVLAIGWPLPSEAPSLDAIANALRYGRIAPSTLLRSLAVVAWILWAVTVLSIALEASAVLRGTMARAVPGLAGLQTTAARLIATAMLLSSLAGRAAAAGPEASLPPPPGSIQLTDTHDPERGRAVEPRTADESRSRFWTVRRRDSLWTIAERSLGDGHRWREIAALNQGRVQADGGQLRPGDTLIRPGWRLALPSDAADAGDAVDAGSDAQIVVDSGDDLWSLAVEHLGDGARWPDIHARNLGRPQRDGRRLTDPDLIRPGWVLRLPSDDGSPSDTADAADAEARPAPMHPPPSPRATDRAGGTATPGSSPPSHRTDAPAARTTTPSPAEPDAPTSTPDRRPPSHRTDEPAARRAPTASPRSPGGTATQDSTPRGEPRGRSATDMPPPVTPSTMPTTPSSTGTTAEPTAPASVTPLTAPMDEREPTRSWQPGAGAALGGAAVLAAGLVGLLARRRRHWLQRRAGGTALDPVEPEAAELERWLRSMADHDLHERLDRVLRVLSDHFAEYDVAPAVSAVEFGEHVTLRLVEPEHEPPPGVTSSPDGTRWTLAPELEMAPTGPRRFLPALVSCGRLESGSLLLLNLLDTGLLSVVGDAVETAAALTSWTAELAAGGAAGGVEIVIVGAHHPLVERLPRVSVVDDTDQARERVRRVIEDADGFASRIVVMCGSMAHEQVEPLITAAAHPGVAVVLDGGQQAGGTWLELADARVRLHPDGAWFDAPDWLSPLDWDRFGDLLRQPDRDAFPAPSSSPLSAVVSPGRPDPLGDLASEPEDDGAIEIGLLGPLTVDGRPATIDPQDAPLLTYLAAHPTGGDPATLAAMLWPAHPDHASCLERATAALTTALEPLLGPTPLVPTSDGRLELPSAVTTDVRRLGDLLRQLDLQPPAEQARRLYTALELVRGEPFPIGADWAHADGTAVRTGGLIVDAAHRLAVQSLTVGDVERADWAIDAGLRAAPTCELLYRDRMRVADARGDRAALDACMRELHSRVEADQGWVTTETTALYSRLRGAPWSADADDRHQDAS